MAGSYSHITTDDGAFVDFETFIDMIENLGDAYEMAQEMFGMIGVLSGYYDHPEDAIEHARQNYEKGLTVAPVEGER